jgi:hypothetical protein
LEFITNKKNPVRDVSFTGLLPHYIEKHLFFPSGPTYSVDVPFLLHALGFKK